MHSVGDNSGVSVKTMLTRVSKYQIFSGSLWFLQGETINLLSIPHIAMNFDNFLTHFRFFFETTPDALCPKVCKLSLTSYL